MHWYVDVLKQYATFSGRARRPEFWMFTLINFIIGIVLSIVDSALGTSPVLGLLYSLAVLLPGLAVSVRRLHDTDRTGWWLLISLIPIVGTIVLLVFLASDSKPHDNAYGPYAPAPASAY